MKNKITYLFALISIFLVSSCNDFLDIKDQSAINPGIWDNEASAKLYVNNIYSMCLSGFGGESLTTSMANLSDETTSMGSQILLGTLAAGTIGTYANTGPYEAIRYINIAFDAMKSSKMTTDEKNRTLGQLYFFRAWMHWKLINLYGGVPYMRDYVTFESPDSIKNAPRNKTSECISYLKQDLDSAISKLPAAWAKDEYSRITRAAAAGFKGRVLLFYASPQFNPDHNIDRWKDAYDANVFANTLSLNDGYALMPITAPVTKQWPYGYDFNQVFLKKKTDANTEVMIVTPYYTDIKVHSYENSVCPGEVTGGGSSLCPSWDLVIAFPMKDGSMAFSSKNTRKFIGDIDAGKYYLNRDPRFYATVAFNGCYYQLEGNANRRLWTFYFTRNNKKIYYGENTTSDKISSTGFLCRKMVNPTLSRDNMAKSITDWVEMRYAEVLLNLAECAFEVEGNDSPLAFDCLTQIRKRAGIDAGVDGSYGLKGNITAGLSPIEVVMNERRVELAFEGKRFYDLRRRNMFTSDLGSYIYKLNGWKKSSSYYTFGLKYLKTDSIMFMTPTSRDTIQLETVYKYFSLVTPIVPPSASQIKYLCVPDSATLRNTNTGNYNFFDIPVSILTRSMAIDQTIGWQNGKFNPFQ